MGRWQRLRRPDWLAEMQSALMLTLAIAACGAVFGVIGLLRSDSVEVPVLNNGLVAASGVTGLAPGVRVQDGGTVDVVVDDPSPGQVALSAARAVPTYLIVVFTLAMLLQVVRAARRDDPFSAANVRLLRVTGWVVLAGGPAAFVAELIATLALSSSVVTGPPGSSVEVTWWWLPVGFGFLAIAEVINRGRVMRAELAEVI